MSLTTKGPAARTAEPFTTDRANGPQNQFQTPEEITTGDTIMTHESKPQHDDQAVTGPVSRVILTHPILGNLESPEHPSPASAEAHAALLRTELAGLGWTITVTDVTR